jgi:cytochrome d ubiquinol oxidase subunit I
MAIWLAALGTVFSAYFILAANSFMQNPVGFTYNADRGRAEMTDFMALLTNPVVVITFPHQLFGCFMVAGAFIAGVAGWHLLRLNRAGATPPTNPESGDKTGFEPKENPELSPLSGSDGAGDKDDQHTWRTAIKIGAITLLVASLGIIITGDLQGKVMTQVQPMKMAAAEALYETEKPASFSVITIGTPDGQRELWSIKIPNLLSILATGKTDGEVQGIRELPKAYETTYGPGTYSPNIPLTYWTFRWMIALGAAGALLGLVLLWSIRGGRGLKGRWWPPLMIALPLLPLFANSMGWIFTETGRQPWLVFGLLPTAAGVSPGTTVAEVLTSMIVFTGLYSGLAVIEVRLMLKYIRSGLPALTPANPDRTDHTDDSGEGADAPLEFAY